MAEKKSFSLEINCAEIKGELYFADLSTLHGKKNSDNFNKTVPGIIICHGIPAGLNPDYNPNSSSGYEKLALLFSGMGYNSVIFNFSGTGKSGGNLDLSEWVEQLQAVIYFYISYITDLQDKAVGNLKRNTGKEKEAIPLHLLGFSAGAAVSVMVAASLYDSRAKEKEIEKKEVGYQAIIYSMALCACPANFRFLPDKFPENGLWEWFQQAGFFRDSKTLAPKEKWMSNLLTVEPERVIHKIHFEDILFIHGGQDDLVLPEHATRLFSRAEGNKKIIILPEEGHQLRHSETVINHLKNWFM